MTFAEGKGRITDMRSRPESYEGLRRRLARGVAVLERVESRRRASGDPHVGSNIERLVIRRELDDLMEDIQARPGPLARFLRPAVGVRRRRSAEI